MDRMQMQRASSAKKWVLRTDGLNNTKSSQGDEVRDQR